MRWRCAIKSWDIVEIPQGVQIIIVNEDELVALFAVRIVAYLGKEAEAV